MGGLKSHSIMCQKLAAVELVNYEIIKLYLWLVLYHIT